MGLLDNGIFLSLYITLSLLLSYSIMAPTRTSHRIRKKNAAAAALVTPATRRSTQKSISASSTDHRCSVAPQKSTTPARLLVRNPYAKDKTLRKSLPEIPPILEFLSAGNPLIPPPSTSSNPPPSKLPAPSQSPATGTLLLPVVAPTIPSPTFDAIDGTINFTSMQAPSDFTLPGILQSIANHPIRVGPNLLATDLNELNFNDDNYEKSKGRIINRFFQVLTNNSVAHPLADMIVDPLDPTTKKRRLFILCRAPSTPTKHKILNWAILIYSLKCVKVPYRNKDLSVCPKLYAEAQYEPGSSNTGFKLLFWRFRKEQIFYSQSKDFNGPGESVFRTFLLLESIDCFLLSLSLTFLC